jgi:type II secretory pathway component GspD/PulD (secretin)
MERVMEAKASRMLVTLFLLSLGAGCESAGTTRTTISTAPDGAVTINKQDSDIDQVLKATQSASNAAQAVNTGAQAFSLIKSLSGH